MWNENEFSSHALSHQQTSWSLRRIRSWTWTESLKRKITIRWMIEEIAAFKKVYKSIINQLKIGTNWRSLYFSFQKIHHKNSEKNCWPLTCALLFLPYFFESFKYYKIKKKLSNYTNLMHHSVYQILLFLLPYYYLSL